MTTPNIRTALDTFQQAANHGSAVYLSPDLVQELRDALKAEPEGEGRSCAGLLPVEPPNISTTMAMQYRSAWREGVEDGWNEARTILAGLGHPTPPALPPNYIDPEHTGQDRELLETFYRAARADGGTADECILRGVKAVLATHPANPPAPEPLNGYLQDPPAPEPGEVGELVNSLTLIGDGMNALNHEADSWVVARAATLLQQQESGLAALRGVPVSERLPREEDCDDDGFCWNGYGYSYDDKNEIDSYALWMLVPKDDLRGEVWLPHAALPLPAPQAGEGEA